MVVVATTSVLVHQRVIHTDKYSWKIIRQQLVIYDDNHGAKLCRHVLMNYNLQNPPAAMVVRANILLSPMAAKQVKTISTV